MNLNPIKTGKIIKYYRKEKGLTQEKFSNYAGFDKTHYSKIERGLRIPNLESFFKISRALDIAPEILIIDFEKALQ